MKTPGKITPEIAADITERLLAGETHQTIAMDHDLDTSAVSYFKKRNSIVCPRRRTQQDEPCDETGCGKGAKVRGYCMSHYNTRNKRGEFINVRGEYRTTAQIRRRMPRILCDHSSSRCDCVSSGKTYNEYLRDSGQRLSPIV